MDNRSNKKIFKKVTNGFLIFLGIIFLFGGIIILLEGDRVYGGSLLIVGISFFPYIYNKIKSLLSGIVFTNSKQFMNNFGKIYFSIFFIIFIIGIIGTNGQERLQRDESYLSVNYLIDNEITNKENITVRLKQKHISEITINNEIIDFDKNKEIIDKLISLDLGENEIIIKGKNNFYQNDFSKTLTRLSEEEYQSYLTQIGNERLKQEQEEQKRLKEIREREETKLKNLNIQDIHNKKPYILIEFLNKNYGNYFPEGIVETLQKNYIEETEKFNNYDFKQFGNIFYSDIIPGFDISVCFYSNNTFCSDNLGLSFTSNKNNGYDKQDLLRILNLQKFTDKKIEITETEKSITIDIFL